MLASPVACPHPVRFFALSRYICLDEGDRMLDMGFDEEVREAFVFGRGGCDGQVGPFDAEIISHLDVAHE